MCYKSEDYHTSVIFLIASDRIKLDGEVKGEKMLVAASQATFESLHTFTDKLQLFAHTNTIFDLNY